MSIRKNIERLETMTARTAEDHCTASDVVYDTLRLFKRAYASEGLIHFSLRDRLAVVRHKLDAQYLDTVAVEEYRRYGCVYYRNSTPRCVMSG